ncbi:hypothetical protein NXF25_018973 [Crotalus adamanteus]|uniref:Uncharacterized protein n=1 Tax=Crotalus adamanteus TaxID=8729 RepID=A0AAW1B0I7_CROAD
MGGGPVSGPATKRETSKRLHP